MTQPNSLPNDRTSLKAPVDLDAKSMASAIPELDWFPDAGTVDRTLDSSRDNSHSSVAVDRFTAPPKQTEPAMIQPRQSSLRSQLLRSILPVVLLPLMLASGIGFQAVQQRHTERIQRQLEDQVLLTSEGTREVLEELRDIPRTIAQNPLVINEAIAGSQEAESKGLPQQSIAELESRFRDTKLLRSHQALNAYLQSTAETQEISELLITEKHGLNVAYSKVPTDFVQRDETWWQQGSQAGQWISPPDFDFAAKSFTIEVVQAIQDPRSKSFTGVVRAVLPARKFSLLAQYVRRTGISGSQRVQLIDAAELSVIDTFSAAGFRRDRQIIGGDPIEQLLTALTEFRQSQNQTQAIAIPPTLVTDLSNKLALQDLTVQTLEDGTIAASFGHQNKQYKLATIPQTNWVAIASMDQGEMTRAGYDVLLIFGLTTLLLGSITTGLILLLSRQIAQPLGSLARTANQAAAGHLSVVSEPKGTQETQVLAQAFNQLVLQVKQLLRQHETEILKAQLFTEIAGTIAAESVTPPDLLEQTLERLREILVVDRLVFYRIDETQGKGVSILESVAPNYPSVLKTIQRSGYYPAIDMQQIPSILVLDQQSGTLLPFYTAIQPTLNHPAPHPAPHPDPLQAEAFQVQSSLVVPVCNRSTLLGILIAHNCHTPHQWTDAEIDTVQQLAVQFKLILQRSRV